MTISIYAAAKRAAAKQDARRELLEIARTLDELTYIDDDAELVRRLGPIVNGVGGIEAHLGDIRRQLIQLVVNDSINQRAAAELLGMQQSNVSTALRRDPTGRAAWLIA